MAQQVERDDAIALRMGSDIETERLQVAANPMQEDHGLGALARFDEACGQPAHIHEAM
jgi:hypothetical protein